MDYCQRCDKPMEGGVWTSGDGFGDAKKVGLPEPVFKHYCWDCYEIVKDEINSINKVIDLRFEELKLCGFLEAWIGRCQNPQPCEKHISQKCWSCGERATSNCSEAGSLVCGTPQCSEHSHSQRHPINIFGM